jgi:sterol desaturase/sphingolipid hydroxylase (fatty acid hydroxylase superfamily)
VLIDAWERVSGTLTNPIDVLFAPYLLAAAVVVTVVTRSGLADWSGALSRRAVLHRSTLHDFAMFLVSRIFLAPLLFLLPVPSRLTAVVHENVVGVVGQHHVVRGWPAAIVVTLVVFLSIDFSRYVMHRSLHRVGVLWRFHRTHHSAPVMTPLTVFRNHPLDELVLMVTIFFVLGISRGLALVVVEPRPEIKAYGYNVLFFSVVLFSSLKHSHAWITYGSRIERWVYSPAQHQIHHSTDPRDHDKNFGSFFSIWDRAFGTLATAGPRRPITFGLTDADAGRHTTLASLYLEPFRRRPRPASSTGAGGGLATTPADRPSASGPVWHRLDAPSAS